MNTAPNDQSVGVNSVGAPTPLAAACPTSSELRRELAAIARDDPTVHACLTAQEVGRWNNQYTYLLMAVELAKTLRSMRSAYTNLLNVTPSRFVVPAAEVRGAAAPSCERDASTPKVSP